MEDVLLGFWTLIALLISGILLVKFRIVPKNFDQEISRIVFMLTMPALVFLAMCESDIAVVFSLTAAVGIINSVILFFFYYLLAVKIFKLRAGEQTIGALSASYVNAGNLGIAYLMAITGDAAASAPVMLFQLLIVAPIVFIVLEKQRSTQGNFSPSHLNIGRIVLRALLQPPVIAVVLGLLVSVSGWQLPAVIYQPVNMLSHCAVPLVMLAMGVSLGSISLRHLLKANIATYVAVFIRVFASPLLTFFLAKVFALSPAMLLTAMVVSAFPSANNVFIFAHRYETGVELARDTVVLSTLLSMPVLLLIAAVF